MKNKKTEKKSKKIRKQIHSGEQSHIGCAWVVSADMGYGHQRAAYPLKDIAFQRILTANNDKIISEKEHRIWENSRLFYEFVSRLKHIPLIGKAIFNIYDKLQKISPMYPFRDLSKPNFSVIRLKKLIKKGLCKSLIEYVDEENKKYPHQKIPVITTHFIPALAWNYAGKEIYCVVTDTDINRVWVPDNPKESKIIYLAPCQHAVLRLKQYGIPENKIIETGFPLPKENIGEDKKILKSDLIPRFINLDPKGIFFEKYGEMVKAEIGLKHKIDFKNIDTLKKLKTHPLTLTFMVGGAGAQKDIGIKILKSLREKIKNNEIVINLIAGIKLEIKSYFEKEIVKIGLKEHINKNIKIIYALDKKTYFGTMNECLRTTDIIWTKPSEMSFYTALGLPIIIAPPIGAHENFNKEWLEHIGSGFVQEAPEFVKDWLFYWINDGRLADAALQGYVDAPCMGTYEIEKILKENNANACPEKITQNLK